MVSIVVIGVLVTESPGDAFAEILVGCCVSNSAVSFSFVEYEISVG